MTESAETVDDLELEDTLPQPKLNEVIANKYRITRLLGRGGSGSVYQAEHLELGRRYAIKFLSQDRASSTHALARFKREARTLATLTHEGIASVIDIGEYHERAPFIVLDYVEGQTLRSVMKSEAAMPLDRALQIMLQLCAAIAYAHHEGVVHRDLKPENLMLPKHSDGMERVCVLDFGIARTLSTDEPRLTPSGAQLGTPHYMAPEQAKGSKTVGPTADVYSMGVLFYELLSGTRPHPGDTYYEVIFHVLTQPPIPLQQAAPSCPADVRKVVERCIQRNADDRYPSAKELGEAIERLRLVHGSHTTQDYLNDTGLGEASKLSNKRWPIFALGLGLGAAAMLLLGSFNAPDRRAASETPLTETETPLVTEAENQISTPRSEALAPSESSQAPQHGTEPEPEPEAESLVASTTKTPPAQVPSAKAGNGAPASKTKSLSLRPPSVRPTGKQPDATPRLTQSGEQATPQRPAIPPRPATTAPAAKSPAPASKSPEPQKAPAAPSPSVAPAIHRNPYDE